MKSEGSAPTYASVGKEPERESMHAAVITTAAAETTSITQQVNRTESHHTSHLVQPMTDTDPAFAADGKVDADSISSMQTHLFRTRSDRGPSDPDVGGGVSAARSLTPLWTANGLGEGQPPPPTKKRIFKIIVIGDSNVGKTCLTFRFCNGKFPEKTEATIGVDFREKTLNIGGEMVKVRESPGRLGC